LTDEFSRQATSRFQKRHSSMPGSADTKRNPPSAPPTASAAGSPRRLQGNPEPNDEASHPHYLLPKDLAGALKRLSDDEIDALLSAATVEAQRRDRPQQSQTKQKPPIDPKAPHRRLHVQDAGMLTTGKLNAVRAAFKAGVKPSAIARQFGISKFDVGRVLAEARNRKSGR
jgi:hypothetical protein